jgi:hypothetical protein
VLITSRERLPIRFSGVCPAKFAARRRDGGVLSCDTVPGTRSPAAAEGGAPPGPSGAAQLGEYRRAGRVRSDVHQNPNELGAICKCDRRNM